jgi:hypothetical protein
MRTISGDHHLQTLWALKTMLQENPKFELAGEAADTIICKGDQPDWLLKPLKNLIGFQKTQRLCFRG